MGFSERDKPLDSDDDLEWTPSLRDTLMKEAHSLEHSLTHFPKNRYCEVCRRAKMTQRVHCGKKGADKEGEETPPLHFGHRLRADHIILGSDLTKGSEGEQACFICYGDYSGRVEAFAMTQRTVDHNIVLTAS